MWRAKYLVCAADCELERARGARVCAEILRGDARGDGARRRRYEQAVWARRHAMRNERVCAASLLHTPAVMYWGRNASIEHYLRFVHIHNVGVQPSCPPRLLPIQPRPLPNRARCPACRYCPIDTYYPPILTNYFCSLFSAGPAPCPPPPVSGDRAASLLRAASRQRRSRS